MNVGFRETEDVKVLHVHRTLVLQEEGEEVVQVVLGMRANGDEGDGRQAE